MSEKINILTSTFNLALYPCKNVERKSRSVYYVTRLSVTMKGSSQLRLETTLDKVHPRQQI